MLDQKELAKRFPNLTAEEIAFYCDYEPEELEILTMDEIEAGTLKLLTEANDELQRAKDGRLDAITEDALKRADYRKAVIAFYSNTAPENDYQRRLRLEALKIERDNDRESFILENKLKEVNELLEVLKEEIERTKEYE